MLPWRDLVLELGECLLFSEVELIFALGDCGVVAGEVLERKTTVRIHS